MNKKFAPDEISRVHLKLAETFSKNFACFSCELSFKGELV